MSKRPLKIDISDYREECIDGDYAFSHMEFALATAMSKKGIVEPLDSPDSCRESLCQNVREYMDGVDNLKYFDKTRLILYWAGHKERKKAYYAGLNTQVEKTVTVGIKIINLYEGELGWPLTKIHFLENDISARHMFYYVVGSKRWIKAPALLSLYTLLLRLGQLTHQASKFSGKFTTFDGAIKALDKEAKKKHISGDISYYKQHKDKWMFFLSNYKRLFSKRDMSDLWSPAQNHGSSFFSEGINTLCDHDTQDVKLQLAIEKIWKESEKK